MVERNTYTDGGAYVPGRVNTDGGDFVGRDYRQTTIIFNSSSQEELKRYLKTAVANYERTLYGGLSLSSASLDQPYKSLYPFEIEDADIFFGRDAAIEDLYEAVLKDRLTILHAKSGTGKTSLLNAGLSPRLILERRLPVYVRRQDDPVGAVKQSIAPSMSGLWPESLVELTLYEFLGLVCADCLSRKTEELVVILDQFEEFFIFGPERERGWPFIEDLAQCYSDKTLPVRFVIALRSDYFSHLATFQSHLPCVFYNEYYLEPMTREAARAAITEPVKKRGKPICYEPTLLDNLLHDLKIVDAPTHPDIELPHLQIICTQLYEEASDKGEATITLDAYEKLGGTKGILGRYLNSRLKSLPGSEALIARDALKELVGSEATRRRLPRTTLVARVNAREDELDDVLDRLVRARLLRRDEAEGEPMYEVVHEYLVEEIKEKWIDQEDLKFKEVEEMLDREMANWNVHKTLMPRDRLKLVYEQRKRLKGLPAEKWKLILSSALESNFEVLDWAERAGKVGEMVLLARLDDQCQEIGRIAMKVLGIIWQLPEVSKLADGGPRVRQMAARQLGERGDPRTLKPLSAVLRDKDSDVRREACRALLKLGEPAMGPLFDALHDKDRDVRLSVARVFGELKLTDPRAIEPLIGASKDENRDVRQAVLEALVKLGSSRAEEVLCAALQDKDTQVRRTAVEGLITLGGSDAIQALSAALQDQNSQVRCTAVEGLIELADSQAVQKLSAVLKEDGDNGVRLAAVEGLVKLGVPGTVQSLVGALQDSDSDVRQAAVEGLIGLGELAVEPLVTTLSNESWHLRRVRESAARALGKIGDPRATQSLIATLRDGTWEVRWTATEALGELGDPDAIEPLAGVLRDKDAILRRAAVEALGKLGFPQAVEPLIATLGDEDSGVRQVAAEALIKRGKPVVESLINALRNKDRTLRQEAIQTLVRLGELAVEPLINALQDRNQNQRLAAIEVLAQLRDPRAVVPLTAILEDRHVRKAAGAALVLIGPPAVEPLHAALRDKSKGRGFRRSVTKTLKEIGTPEASAALGER